MKRLVSLLFCLVTLTVFARSEEIQFTWDYPHPTNNVVFKMYLSTNAPGPTMMFAPVSFTTSTNIVYTNSSPNVLTFYVTASNTVRQAESPPSNQIQIPAIPYAPTNYRLISITVRP